MIIEGGLLRIFDLVIKVAFLLVAEGLAIGDWKLQITRVRAIDIWIIDLVEDAVAQGKQSVATRVVRGPDTLLAAARPFRANAR